MKTTTKLVVSICALTLIFTACKKDAVTPVIPEPVLDCNEIENGVSAYDDCGECQGAFLYNFTTHNPMDIVMLGGDTSGAIAANAATTDSIICVLPEDPMNLYWNASCSGCTDSTAFNYDPNATEDNGSCCIIAGCIDALALNYDPTACYDDGSCILSWIDCFGFQNGVAVIDSCGDCQEAYVYNMLTHDPAEIVMLGGDTNGVSATLLLPGLVIILPEDAGNPYWNSGCK